MLPRPAIGTVAAEARVSIKTVSRVINNSRRVTAATREHVMGVIRRLNYSPSPTARRLAGHRSYLVGLPFDNPYASYVTEVQSGSLASFRDANYQVVMHACDARSPQIADEIHLFVDSVRVDGVILTPPLSDMSAVIAVLESEAIPFVRIAPSTRSDPARSIFTNDREACAAMTRHLICLGHRRIGFVIGQLDHAGTVQRYNGYCDGLETSGLNRSVRLVAQGDGTFESAVECTRRLLEKPSGTLPTAIVASNDAMAAGVLTAARMMGIAVPDELSIAGFGDEPLAAQMWPRLSTIRQPLHAMAQQAATLLMRQLRGETADHLQQPPRLIESTLVLRQSTAAARAP